MWRRKQNTLRESGRAVSANLIGPLARHAEFLSRRDRIGESRCFAVFGELLPTLLAAVFVVGYAIPVSVAVWVVSHCRPSPSCGRLILYPGRRGSRTFSRLSRSNRAGGYRRTRKPRLRKNSLRRFQFRCGLYRFPLFSPAPGSRGAVGSSIPLLSSNYTLYQLGLYR